jgi:acyl-CoA-dependent ceramide synthase
MIPELKRYYIMQLSYWCQQLIVLLLGLEKPRKDYKELVAHHFVTLWLIRLVPNVRFCAILNIHPSLQLELPHQSHIHRKCSLYEHGYPRCLPGGRSIIFVEQVETITPMTCAQFSKLLNYMQWDRAKTVAFGVFVLVWS